MEAWAKRIKALADDEELNDSDIAKIVGVAPNSVTQWWGRVQGKPPTKEIKSLPLVKIAKRLNTTAEYLLTGTPPASESQPVRLDGETLRLGITLVRGVLKANNVTKFDVLEDADEIVQAMQFVLARQLTSVTADNVLDFMQARAEKKNERTSRDGQADRYAGLEGKAKARAGRKPKASNG